MEEVVDRKLAMQEVTFMAHKRARRSGRNWKRRFFSSHPQTQELTYFKPRSSKVKGSYFVTEHTELTSLDVFEKKSFVLKIDDPESGLMYLCFKTDVEIYRISAHLQDAIDFRKHKIDFRKHEEASRHGSMIEEGGNINDTSYMDMKKVMQAEVDEGRSGRESRTDTIADDAAFTQLVKRYQEGKITDAEFVQLVDNMEDVREASIEPDAEDDIDNEFNIQVTCDECQTLNNTSRGPKCRLCRADLQASLIHFL
jgi:hypothetical protein